MKKYLIAGLLIWLPLLVTVWILGTLISFLDTPIQYLPDSVISTMFLDQIPGVGILLSLSVLIATGVFATNFFGEKVLHWWQLLLVKIPIVSTIYNSVKQVSDTLLASNGQAFDKALLVRWPYEGMWTIAFQTGTPHEALTHSLEGDFISVYVPSTPNPTGGYFVIVERSQVIELNISVDTALKYVLSMGIVGSTPVEIERSIVQGGKSREREGSDKTIS